MGIIFFLLLCCTFLGNPLCLDLRIWYVNPFKRCYRRSLHSSQTTNNLFNWVRFGINKDKSVSSPSHNKKVDGDDEEKKTGDYLLIPGGEKFFEDKKYQSSVKNKKKHKQSHFYHCRGECEYERQGQSETLTERLLLWRGTWWL